VIWQEKTVTTEKKDSPKPKEIRSDWLPQPIQSKPNQTKIDLSKPLNQ
jgi:hypothetical protein